MISKRPLLPAKAGTQAFFLSGQGGGAMGKQTWVPAFAGMSGVWNV
jgi:hypothetical protein